MKKDMLRLGLALALFAAGACVALALVYAVTGPTIAGLEEKNLQASLKDLFPDADSFDPIADGVVSEDPGILVKASWRIVKGGETVGIAIKAVGKSYGGDAGMLIGVGPDGCIAGVRILNLNDTPGLGANAVSPTYFVDKTSKTTFPGQFAGKAVTDAFEVKADVDVITASTITSRALATIVKNVGRAGSRWLESGQGGGK